MQRLDARAIQDFFHPQLTIQAVDLLATFLAFSKLPLAPLRNRSEWGGYMWWGQSADTLQNASCRNIFHGPLPPEAWRDRTVRQRDGVNLSEQRLRPNTFRREQAPVFIGDAVSNHLLRCKTLLTEFFQLPYRPVSALLRSNRFSQCLPELNPLMPECFRQPVRQPR